MMNNWESFEGKTTKVCLQCGYRWPIHDLKSVTDEPGCPNCGYGRADILTETHASDWNDEDLLGSARIEVEVFAHVVDGVQVGWLKDAVDEFLKILTTADLDTSSRISGVPADVYNGFLPPQVHGPEVPDDLVARVRHFLDELRQVPKTGFQQWSGEEHRN